MTRTIVLLAGLLLAATITPQAARAQTTCPPDGQGSRAIVERFLARPGFGPDRAQLSLAGATMSNVRVLTDASDAAACQSLSTAVGATSAGPNWRVTFYRVGNYYFVAFRRSETANTRWLGFVPLYIFDTAFNQVNGLTM